MPITDVGKILEIGRQISPVTHVSSDDPPTLIIHGDKDFLVPIQQAELILDKLKAAGVETKLVVKKGEGHGWPEWHKDMVTIADWFDAHLKAKEKAAGESAATKVLTTLGTHSLFDGRILVDLVEEDGKIHCLIHHEKLASGSFRHVTGPIQPLFDKDAKWFVYPRWSDEVWSYDGREFLIAHRYPGPHHKDLNRGVLYQVSPELQSIKMLPEEVKGRLPKEFLDRFKDNQPSSSRASAG